MKILKLGLALALCTTLCGCMTAMTVDAAKGEPGEVVTKANGEQVETKQTKQTKPGYYWLIPLSVTGDVITMPCQAIFIFLWMAGGGGPC
jgi:uncharacterized protein YceK